MARHNSSCVKSCAAARRHAKARYRRGLSECGSLSNKSFAAGCWRTPRVGNAQNRVPVRQAATADGHCFDTRLVWVS